MAPQSREEEDNQKLERLLFGHKLLQDDFNHLRADFRTLLQCLEDQNIVQSQTFLFSKDHRQQDAFQDTVTKAARQPSQTFASVMGQKTPAERIFSAAGQMAWSSTRRVSKTGLLLASAVEREKIIVLGGVTNRNPRSQNEFVKSLEAFDVHTGRWEVLQSLAQANPCSSACEMGGYIYVAGGKHDTVMRLHPAVTIHGKWAWSPMPRLRKARHSCALVALDGHVYVLGGYCDVESQALDLVERLDPRKTDQQEWEQMCGMRSVRRAFVAVALEHKIYVCGGSNIGHLVNAPKRLDVAQSGEVFSPGSPFAPIPRMVVPRIDHAGAAVGGKIVVSGGADPSHEHKGNTVEVFEPTSAVWTLCWPMGMKLTRGAHVAVVAAGRLYLVGGGRRDAQLRDGATSSAEYFDFEASAWMQLPGMHHARMAFAAAVVKVGPSAAK